MNVLKRKRKHSRTRKEHSYNPNNKYKMKKVVNNKIMPNLNIKQNFVAKINDNANLSKDDINFINEIMKGEDIIFEERKRKGNKIFEDICNIDINNKNNHKIIKDEINKGLFYDNINRKNIYKSLQYYKKMNEVDEFNNLIKKAQYSLTKNFQIIDNNNFIDVDLNKEFKIPKDIIIFEDDKSIIEEIKSAINHLELISGIIDKIKKENLIKNEILKTKIKKDKDGLYNIEEKHDNNEDLNNIYNNIYYFLFYYILINSFQCYNHNQPIDYHYNSTIYLMNIFFRIYYDIVDLKKWYKSSYLVINEKIMKKFYSLKEYKDHIFKLIENNNNKLNKEIDDKFELLFYYLESDKFPNDLNEIIKSSILKNEPLTIKKIEDFIKSNINEKKNFTFNNNILNLKYEGKEYEFNYKLYNQNLLKILEDNTVGAVIEQSKWNKIGMFTYFDEEDINFLKNLLKKILQSKLFQEIYSKYSNVENIIDYYFTEDKNLEDLINRIRFFPFDEQNTGVQAFTTKRSLKIITSSFYISNIQNNNDFINYKILEMGRKLIILIHEVFHFIKRALNLITNGKVQESTIDNPDKEDPNIIEAGRFFELLLFNWENPYKKNRNRSAKSKNKKKEDDDENPRFLNIEKVLMLLNANFYEQNIIDFKNNFENGKTEKINKELEEYLNSIKFDINNYYEKKEDYDKYKINCSRKNAFSYYIEYTSDNHNLCRKFNNFKTNFLK